MIFDGVRLHEGSKERFQSVVLLVDLGIKRGNEESGYNDEESTQKCHRVTTKRSSFSYVLAICAFFALVTVVTKWYELYYLATKSKTMLSSDKEGKEQT